MMVEDTIALEGKEVDYKTFKKAIEYVARNEMIVVTKIYEDKDRNGIEELILINGVMFSIGNRNDRTTWCITKINDESLDGFCETIIACRDYFDFLESLSSFTSNFKY